MSQKHSLKVQIPQTKKVLQDCVDSEFRQTRKQAQTQVQTSTVPADVVTAAINLKKGETSDWITVTNSSGTSLYRVYVKETDSNKIFNAKNDTVSNQALYAILNSDSSLSYKILNSYAKKLDAKTQR